MSRTWSRHAPPDWTNQARLVERGADIVINRDSAMEEGKAVSDEKAETSTKRASTVSTGVTLKKSPVHEDGSEDKEDAEMDSREEFPPDGTDKVMEWQEPHRKIIEKREGPGEDVSFLISTRCSDAE